MIHQQRTASEWASGARRVVRIVCLAGLASFLADAGYAETWTARATGEHALVATDDAAGAEQLATLDGQVKLWSAIERRLDAQPSIKTLGLSSRQLRAYIAGLIEVPTAERIERLAAVCRVELSVAVDLEDLSRRLELVHHDGEAAVDLADSWNRIERLQAALAAHQTEMASAPPDRRAGIAERRQKTAAALQIDILLAQASVALVRRENGTTSLPVVAPDGAARARARVERALALDPSSTDARVRLAEVLLVERRSEEAERLLREAVLADPASALKHNKLGNALYMQSKFDEAVPEFREAIRLNPLDAISHSDLAETLRLQGNITGAIAEFREAIRLDPHYMTARHSLGIILAEQQRQPEALVEFREVIRLRPSSARGHYNAAIVLANLDEDEESAKAWREAVRLNPSNYNAHFNLGEMLRLTGELEESAKEFREYVTRAPDSPATQKHKARARSYIEAFEEQ